MINLSEKLLIELYRCDSAQLNKLAAKLNCSTDTVLATIESLQRTGTANIIPEGLNIRLSAPLPLLDAYFFRTEFPDRRIEILPVTDSTNTALKRKSDCRNGDVYLAEYQSAGRGQHQRRWISPFAGQLIMSMYWHYPYSAKCLQGLSIRLGLATVKALHQEGFTAVGLKWPNDLYLYGRKLGGILPEIVSRGSNIDIIAGIGINLVCSPQTEQPTAHLSECGHITRHTLTAAVIRAWLAVFCAESAAIRPEEWAKYDIFYQRKIILNGIAGSIPGINRGINENGQILLEYNDTIHTFDVGEVQVKASPLSDSTT